MGAAGDADRAGGSGPVARRRPRPRLGSERSRRNASVANKPFKDLATGLASRGIAVLRYDKRTMVHGAKLAAIDGLHRQAGSRGRRAGGGEGAARAARRSIAARVFVLGHSLGGMLIPRIGAADPALAGLIVMAGPARPLEDAIVVQTRYLAMADGTISPEEQGRIDEAAAIARERVRALTPEDAKSGAQHLRRAGVVLAGLARLRSAVRGEGLKSPMLVLQGERDYQVTMAEFEKWKAALGSRRT